MTGPGRLPAPARWALACLPADWRESVEGDLEEERRRRAARGRPMSAARLTTAVIVVATRLALARATTTPRLGPRAGRTRIMRGFGHDLRHALRRLRDQPGYAVIAALTLAIGIGANTAVFTLAHWLLLRDVPGIEAPSRLVSMGFGGQSGARAPVSFVTIEALRAGMPALDGLAGYSSFDLHVGTTAAEAARVEAEVVTGNYFSVLGHPVGLGRGFGADDERAGAPARAVVSDRLARRLFGAAASALDRTLAVNGHPFTVTGVARPGFHGASRLGGADLWVPIGQHRAALPMYRGDALTDPGVDPFFGMIGRLAPGASVELAGQQADAVRASLAAATPDRRPADWTYLVRPGIEWRPWVRSRLSDTVTFLTGAVSLLLLLTCANLATLVLARAQGRRQETATRLALGASRWRVARLLMAESLVLAVAASAIAVGVAAVAGRVLEGTSLVPGAPPIARVPVAWPVLGFALAVAVVVALLATVVPALRGSRLDLRAGLDQAGRSLAAGRTRAARLLTAAQVAVSIALLVGAALLVRSMAGRLAIPTGFDPASVLSFSVEPGLQGYGPRQEAFYRDLLAGVRAVPGVRAAGLSWLGLYSNGAADTRFTVEGAPGDEPISAASNMVSPGFFGALGLPFVAGRDFEAREFQRSDATGDGVLILTESLARRAFGSAEAAIGRHVVMAYPEGRVRTVVGVVGDTRQRQIVTDTGEMVFEPFGQTFPAGFASVVVALAAPLDRVLPGVRQVVDGLDPDLPIYDVARLDDAIRRRFSGELLVMRLTLVFAGLATMLAAVGLYGVLARSIADRRREFGIRTALGATPGGLVSLVVREAAGVVVTGAVIGVPLCWMLAGYVRSRLFGVTVLDPWSAAAATLVLVAVALVAALPAARRAAGLDPAAVLR
ncbi:MAG: ADOP family duplicated permease [Vicinamibacterales bacterium]